MQNSRNLAIVASLWKLILEQIVVSVLSRTLGGCFFVSVGFKSKGNIIFKYVKIYNMCMGYLNLFVADLIIQTQDWKIRKVLNIPAQESFHWFGHCLKPICVTPSTFEWEIAMKHWNLCWWSHLHSGDMWSRNPM